MIQNYCISNFVKLSLNKNLQTKNCSYTYRKVICIHTHFVWSQQYLSVTVVLKGEYCFKTHCVSLFFESYPQEFSLVYRLKWVSGIKHTKKIFVNLKSYTKTFYLFYCLVFLTTLFVWYRLRAETVLPAYYYF